MGYIVGQYNHNRGSGDDASYIELVTSGTVDRKQSQGDSSETSSVGTFQDECIRIENGLSNSSYYYFKCYIKRLLTDQTFYIKLINYEDEPGKSIEQYIKTVTVQGGHPDEWVSVECVFHPIVQFDTILFQLQRTLDDYRVGTRYPKIAYQELGIINSIIDTKVGTGASLLKIGVQSHPGLVMCINGEEIHTSRSGIYEVKNGVIPVTFFSVVNAAQEATSTLTDWTTQIGARSVEIEEMLARGEITIEEACALYAAIPCASFLNTTKIIEIDPFILDYMYEN